MTDEDDNLTWGDLVDEYNSPAIPMLLSHLATNTLGYPAQVYCITCGTAYVVKEYRPRCNGHVITLCPWCRTDSAPWTNGRGA